MGDVLVIKFFADRFFFQVSWLVSSLLAIIYDLPSIVLTHGIDLLVEPHLLGVIWQSVQHNAGSMVNSIVTDWNA